MSAAQPIPEFGERLVVAYDRWRRDLRLVDPDTGAYIDLTGAFVVYSLIAEDGTLVVTDAPATIATTTATIDGHVGMGDVAIEPGKRYRESWYYMPPGYTPGVTHAWSFVCDIYTTTTTIAPPFPVSSVVAMYPDLIARYPYGATSWAAQVAAVRQQVSARIVGRITREGDVVGMFDLAEHWRHALAACFLRAVSGGAPSIVALAERHDALADAAWPRAVAVDADGGTWDSGTIETTTAAGESMPAVVL